MKACEGLVAIGRLWKKKHVAERLTSIHIAYFPSNLSVHTLRLARVSWQVTLQLLKNTENIYSLDTATQSVRSL